MDNKVRNWFALWVLKSFRDGGDKDYLAARLLNRNQFWQASSWSALQAIEKYLKTILLLSFTSTKEYRHDLVKLKRAVERLPQLSFDLPSDCANYLEELNIQGINRYLDYPLSYQGDELFKLDRCVWHIRRYCQDFYLLPGDEQRAPQKSQELIAEIPKAATAETIKSFHIPYGYLEGLLSGRNKELRSVLVWKNFYFGKYKKHHVRHSPVMLWERPVFMIEPELLSVVEQVVLIPKKTLEELRKHRGEKIVDKAG